MFLPLGDEPNPRGVPVVTYTLIGINVAVFLFVTLPLSAVRPALDDPALFEYLNAIRPQLPSRMEAERLLMQVSAYDLVVFSYGFRPADPSMIALLTSLFLHGGFMHLAGNMLFLWIYGDNVEYRLGPARYLVAYLGTGFLATLSHAVLDFGSVLPMVGASGAISGVLGFYFIWFPRNRVRLWIMLFPFFMNVIYAPARLVLGLYLIVDNLLPFLVTRGAGGGGVAYGAHIGGFLGGLAYAWWSTRREVERRPQDFEPDPEPAATAFDADPSSVRGVRQLIAAGEHGRAAAAYFRLSAARTARLLMPGDSINFGRWLANNGHPDAALVVYQRHLRDYPLGPYAAEAHLGAGLVQLHARDQPTAAYQHLVAVLDADPHPDTEGYARRALMEIAARQKFRTPRVH
ncbi:MAG: rhomboid family intramembrane serine protease [Acidobacteria bacterium]|nr:rhomboid family intramembrane serine protease [Acidobacteriota bacterium]